MTPDLEALFNQLEAAVRDDDRERAAALQQQIADRIAAWMPSKTKTHAQ